MRWTWVSSTASKALLALVTFGLVNITWVLFRAKTLSAAMGMLGAMAGLHANAVAVLPTVKILETILCIAGLLLVQWYKRDRTLENIVAQTPPLLTAGAWACMAFAIIITQGTGDAFIYFQF